MSIALSPRRRVAPTLPSRTALHIEGLRGLAVWGMLNILLPLLFAMTPGRSSINSNAMKFFILSIGVNLLLTHIRVKLPLRIPLPIVFLIALHVWLAVCQYHATFTLARPGEKFGVTDYLFFLYFLFFLQAAALSFYVPKARPIYFNILFIACIAHCGVALLQFVHFGPALTLASYYNDNDLTNWGGLGGTRVVGLSGWPDQLTDYALVGFSFAASALLFRKIKGREYVVAVAFLLVALMPQVRGLYPAVAVLIIWFIWLVAKRNNQDAFGYTVASVAAVGGLMFAAYEKLKYGLNGDTSSLSYRLETGWPQAFDILKVRPFFGIGPEPNFISLQTLEVDRFVKGYPLDNGYLVLGAWGGYPAMGIFIVGAIVTLVTLTKMAKKRMVPIRRRILFTLTIFCSALFWSMLSGPEIFAVYHIGIIFVLGGLLMSNEEEYQDERGHLAY